MTYSDEGKNKTFGEPSHSEDSEEVEDVLRNRGYDSDTIERGNRFYYGKRFPEGNPEKQANKIEARLYRIYPEKYLVEKYQDDIVNKLYSISIMADKESRHLKTPFSYHSELKLSSFDDIDALILDHSVIWGMTTNSKQIKLENPDILDERTRYKVESMFSDFQDVLDEVDGDLKTIKGDEIFNRGKVYQEVLSSLSRTSVVSWEKPFELIDSILRYRDLFDIDIRHPDDILEEAGDFCFLNGYNRYYDYEFIDCLGEISRPLVISTKAEEFEDLYGCSDENKTCDPEDAAIIEAAGEEYDKFAVITYDSDFSYDKELNRLGEEVGSEAVPLLPDCANFILRSLAEKQ